MADVANSSFSTHFFHARHIPGVINAMNGRDDRELGSSTPSFHKLVDGLRCDEERAVGDEEWCQIRDFLKLIVSGELNRKLSSKVDSSDVVQQSLMDVSRDLPSFSGTDERQFRAWLHRVAMRNVIDFGRRYLNAQQRDSSREISLEVSSQSHLEAVTHCKTSQTPVRQLDEELEFAISMLDSRERQVIELRHRMKMSHREVATSMGINEPTARKIWSRALIKLRELLST